MQLKFIKCLFLVFKRGYFHPNIAPEREKTEIFLQLFQKHYSNQLEMGKGFYFSFDFNFLMKSRSTLFRYPQSRIDKLGDLIKSSDNGNAFCRVLSADFNGFLGSKILRRDISRMVLDTGGDYRVSQKVVFLSWEFFLLLM